MKRSAGGEKLSSSATAMNCELTHSIMLCPGVPQFQQRAQVIGSSRKTERIQVRDRRSIERI